MRTVLSSWKEIASYLGKGVRTVQRWERELGLPVRRPKPNEKQIVLAFPQEIDAWLRRQAHRPPVERSSHEEYVHLHSLLQKTMAETQRLRALTEVLMQHAMNTELHPQRSEAFKKAS